MAKHDQIYFVWVNFNGRLYPQKWYGEKVRNSHGQTLGICTAKHLLKANELNLTMKDLATIYPPPKQEGANNE